MKIIDLRSDTVTVPDDGMRRAMYQAEVGDDVYGEDATVNNLQEMAAEVAGKEASLFVSSGSMGNLIPQFVQCPRGTEVIAHKDSHIFHYELSSMAAVAGLMQRPVDGSDGKLTVSSIKNALRPDIYYMPRTGLIEIENTHNAAGGTFYSISELKLIYEFARNLNIPFHMDGARVFNAAAALESAVKEITQFCDTVTFCLSKGLGAPAGSMLCGSKEFICEARRTRKMLGGGMRQAGILAAAGIYSLLNNTEKLKTDHQHAQLIASSIKDSKSFELVSDVIPTNIIYFTAKNEYPQSVISSFREKGILFSGGEMMRIVTHLNVSVDDVKKVCEEIENY